MSQPSPEIVSSHSLYSSINSKTTQKSSKYQIDELTIHRQGKLTHFLLDRCFSLLQNLRKRCNKHQFVEASENCEFLDEAINRGFSFSFRWLIVQCYSRIKTVWYTFNYRMFKTQKQPLPDFLKKIFYGGIYGHYFENMFSCMSLYCCS